MEPEKFGTIVINFLDDTTAKGFQDCILRYDVFKNGEESVEFYHVKKKLDFIDVLKTLIKRITDENYFFFLQINTHGCPQGMGANRDEIVFWREFFFYTRQINTLFDGNLLISLAICFGNAMIQAIELDKRAPFKMIIGSFEKVNVREAYEAFRAFYSFPFPNPKFIPDCVDRMNATIGRTSFPLFYGLTDEVCFDKIIDVDRDPDFFISMVYEQVLRLASINKKGNTFIETVESVRKDLKDFLLMAKIYRSHFLFKDKV